MRLALVFVAGLIFGAFLTPHLRAQQAPLIWQKQMGASGSPFMINCFYTETAISCVR
jgi:hypothetical protein